MIAAAQTQTALPFDPTLILLAVLAIAMFFFMRRSGKAQAAKREELAAKMVPGAEVLTQAGIYGTIVAIDAEHAVTTLETSPGVTLRVHSSTVINVVEPTVPDDASALVDSTPAPAADLDGSAVAEADLDGGATAAGTAADLDGDRIDGDDDLRSGDAPRA